MTYDEEENSAQCGFVPVCDVNDWETGVWSICNSSGVSTRSVTKKTTSNCTGEDAKPESNFTCVNSKSGNNLDFLNEDCVTDGTSYENDDGDWSEYYDAIYNDNSIPCNIGATPGTQTCASGAFGECLPTGECEMNYTWNNGLGVCEAKSRPADCPTIPNNAVWNTSGVFMQTWDGSGWSPVTG